MPSYVITGVSRGIGYEFLRQYSSGPNNTVIGIVRNKAETDKKISEDSDLRGRSNIHILEADLIDYNALKNAAAEATSITGGRLDYLIANAGLVTPFDAYDPIGDLGDKPDEVTKTLRDCFEVNVIANVHLFNLFVPLILKGEAKKVIALSSGFADPGLTNTFEIEQGSLYASSKAALNMVVSKYHAQYKKNGILFMSLAPGSVDVGQWNDATPEQLEKIGGMSAKFKAYAPHFEGPVTPEVSVEKMRVVIENVSIEKGNGGEFLSQNGNKEWL
ncbi:NAD(P)-binding protein [Thozetella sp. PMI_491]|nr:NAD(P)-binding protein [Thozetella sp. PMI_491]